MSLDKYKFVMKYILRSKNTHFYNTNEFVGNVENICIDRTYSLGLVVSHFNSIIAFLAWLKINKKEIIVRKTSELFPLCNFSSNFTFPDQKCTFSAEL